MSAWLAWVLAALATGAGAYAIAGVRLPIEADCPDGAVMVGAPPPAGGERYCRKMGPDGAELRHGWYTSWFRNGQKAAEGEYRDGLREGQWLRWWDNGQKFEDLSLAAGKLDGSYRSWHRTGKPSATGAYAADWQDGAWAFWHENGNKAATGRYERGLQAGLWQYWREDGAFVASGSYAAGLMAAPARAETALLAPARAAGPEPSARAFVDPRVELVSAVLALTRWPELGPWNSRDSRYARDFNEAFLPFKEHAAVRMLDAMIGEGFTFDVPLRWILHYGDPPELPQHLAFDTYMFRRASDKQMTGLAAAMRDFARQSHFMRFFEAHREEYDRLGEAYRLQAPHSGVAGLLERYFREHQSSYAVIIAPMLGKRTYGFRLGPVGGTQVYSVGAPNGFESGRFTFDRDAIRSTLYREFNRAFTEVAIQEAFGSEFRPDLYKLVKPEMDDLGLPTWRWALTEMAVRACEIRLLQVSGFADEALAILRQGVQVERFYWLPYAVERLAEFERRPDRYPTFKDFGRRFLESLDEADPMVIGGRVMFLVRRRGVI